MLLFGIYTLIFFYSQMVNAVDVPTENKGEQDMITILRDAVNKSPILASKNITIGAGTSGLNAFRTNIHNTTLETQHYSIKLKSSVDQTAEKNLKHTLDKQARILLTWQWLDGMSELKNVIIIVPAHALDERFEALRQKNVNLIETDGVLHTRTREEVLNSNSDSIADNISIVVMLPGDTQQEDGSWKLYNAEMATELIQNLPKSAILILNGPRTGKFVSSANGLMQDGKAHRDGIDYITALVAKYKEEVGASWDIRDFKYGHESIWRAALKFCLEHENVALILPGESTSMISEALSLGLKPILYSHTAMTNSSRIYVNGLIDNGRAIAYENFYHSSADNSGVNTHLGDHNNYHQDSPPNAILGVVEQLESIYIE
ncbi:MAG: hypothetical protein SFT93_03735 [Rickettsiaceae bacterium]|nr:hypothetical protein [Rickettsiaceae bacterium]